MGIYRTDTKVAEVVGVRGFLAVPINLRRYGKRGIY